jgi:hypothetical protein
MQRVACYAGSMNKDPFVSVRIKRSLRAKVYRLMKELAKKTGKQVKLHEAFEAQFKK